MTLEEARETFLNRGWIKAEGGTYFDGDKWREAVMVISDYLQKEQCEDLISRQAAIDAFLTELTERERKNLLHTWSTVEVKYFVVDMLEKSPSVQPERTCVNCGRTANNGGWYADGGTRCPIEEHYALPKDGFCHLWEKRNVTDDDYPERRTDGRD